MELTATPCATATPPKLRQVFRLIAKSVVGYCREKLISAHKAVGVTLRLDRAAARIDRLMRRFRRGELVWRERAARKPVPDEDTKPVSRNPGLGLPSDYGWLADAVPLTAIYHGPALTAAMQDEEMQALMGATPEVARTMRPIFRMFGLDEDVLKVPEGYGEAEVLVAEPEPEVEPVCCDAGQSSAVEDCRGKPPSLGDVKKGVSDWE
jgi:hypothetical protein